MELCPLLTNGCLLALLPVGAGTTALVPSDLLMDLRDTLLNAPWTSWDDLWRHVFIDRYLVLFFLPMVPVLYALPQRYLRGGIIATSLLFLGYVFGALYPFIWLAMGAAFYALSERFAIESKRKDVVRWGPPLAAGIAIGGWYIGSMLLALINITRDLNTTLTEQAPWLFPFYIRTDIWKTLDAFDAPPQLFLAIFALPQINGIVIFTARMIHYFSELRRDTIPSEDRSFSNFLAFISFAPTVMQGPIERYRDFQHGIDRCRERRGWHDLAAGFGRIALGLAKNLVCIVVLFPPLKALHIEQGLIANPAGVASYAALFFYSHVMVLFLYLEFSGYCDVAVGLARLLGYRVAENFRRPWLARSLTDMWRRWHITLSFICRDYVFMPLIRKRWNSVAALVITFIFVGALHNMALMYILWGATMGLMVAVNQKWARWMRNLDRRPERLLARIRRDWLRLQPLPMVCAWLVTINAFVLSSLFLAWHQDNWFGRRIAWELIRRPMAALAELLF